MKQIIKEILNKAGISEAEISVPEHESQGHYSTNVALRQAFLDKTRDGHGKQIAPMALAEELSEKIKATAPEGFFEKVEAAPPGFINFWLAPQAVQKEFDAIYKNLKNYGRADIGKGETVIVEYSQPNIAKKMHVGHLRTTIIGDALANVLECLGYKVIRWNYLGDWGTQFGKLIAAYKLWGDKKKVEADPINELQKLYVRFHEEIKSNPELDARGQEEFKKLEDGDRENRKLWEWFKNESLKEFEKTYEALGVKFDTDIGESFYEKEIVPLVARLKKDGIAKESEGALIVPLDRFDEASAVNLAEPLTVKKYNLPPALIQKSDGASLYLTRDIANLEYRIKKYKPAKILYVVGNEQSLHFEQLFAIADILGLSAKTELKHIKYGLVLGEEGKKLATREGGAILLEDVLEKAIHLARGIVDKKMEPRIASPSSSVDKKSTDVREDGDVGETEREEIAAAVSIGALKYGILKENRNTDITFNWAKMLDFTGDSAPYLQYTYARTRSILRKATSDKRFASLRRSGQATCDSKYLNSEIELRIMRKIFEFPDEIARNGEILETNNLANYLYELASLMSSFYETTPVLKEENEERRNSLLALINVTASILKSGLGLLGIKTPERI